MMLSMTRRGFAAGLAAMPIAARAIGAGRRTMGDAEAAPTNPLVRNRADAQVFRHEDGQYYLTGSVPEYDRIVLRRSTTIAGLAEAEERVLWRHEASGPLSGFIWAPEVHQIDGRWYAYFAAGPSGGGEDVFRIRTHVLVCDGADPMSGQWSVLGQFQTPWDSFNLDSTIYVHRGVRYFLWAQREPGIETNSNLYIAPMASPLTLAGTVTRLAVPTLDWEVRGFKVAEAPAVLEHEGKLFISYSASATDDRYCLGLLSADANADIMDPNVWSKAGEPVFHTSEATSVYGPGHNSFTTDEHGRPLLVYHGRDYKEIEGDPLFNPDRHTRVQRLYFTEDGTPDFGVPVGNGPLPQRFSPASRRDLWLGHEGNAPHVGHMPLAQTQYRCIEAEGGAVSLSPILMRGWALALAEDGKIVMAEIAAASGDTVPLQFLLRGQADGGFVLELSSRRGRALAWTESGGLNIGSKSDRSALWMVD